jgi:hypothetical protein
MKKYIFMTLMLMIFQHTVISQQNSALPRIPFKSSEHWIFRGIQDTLIGNWSRISALPQKLYGVVSYYWSDSNKVFICGGADSMGITQKNSYFYDPVTGVYERKADLPLGRAFGKLVRVRDSLYLVGSIGPDFHQPDGAVYKYAPNSDTGWVIKSSSPAPALQEMAVCVYHDTAIYTIGGSVDGFSGVTNIVRTYYPDIDTWVENPLSFPQSLTTADAECIGDDFVVMGGFDGTVLNTVYLGHITPGDSLLWAPLLNDSVAPFREGIFRVGGGVINNLMLFGPGLRDTASYGQIWGFNINDSTWVQFLPNTIDTAGDRPTIAVKGGADSLYFYLFGGILPGITRLRVTGNSERYVITNPFIGIHGLANQVPSGFKLHQNYPNPFNPLTTIKYEVPELSQVRISVFDILGREMKVLVNDLKRAGKYEVIFNGTNYASGIYFLRMSTAAFADTKKMILLK